MLALRFPARFQDIRKLRPQDPPRIPGLPATRMACSPEADDSHGKDQRWLQTPHLPRPRCLPTTAGKEYDLRFPLPSNSHMSAPHWESKPEACWQCLSGNAVPRGAAPALQRVGPEWCRVTTVNVAQ